MFKIKIYASGEQNGTIQIQKVFQIEDKQIGDYTGSDKLEVAFNLLKFYYPGVIIDPKSIGLLTFHEPSIYFNMDAECYGLDENLKKIWS